MATSLRSLRICHPAYPFVHLPLRSQAVFRSSRDPMYRHASTAASPAASAVVVGAGPGGITVLGNLLEQLQAQEQAQSGPVDARRRLVWADPHFVGGRVNARYREVPSNTKVDLFVKFARDVPAFREVVETTPKPNAVTALQNLPQDQGCQLSYAADMCLMLTRGLVRHPGVQQEVGKVTAAVLDQASKTWNITIANKAPISTPRLVLCTGANPISKPLPILQKLSLPHLKPIDLDTALAPSLLSQSFSPDDDAIVAVVGASHSAILVLMNLVRLARSSHPRLRVRWFTRNPLRYAEYRDGWILRDNTGLKGEAAAWARASLDFERFGAASPVRDVVARVWTSRDGEDAAYGAELPGCTHIVQAVGYQQNPLPALQVLDEGQGGVPKPLDVEFDNDSGRFFRKSEQPEAGRTYLPGLFGAGIAFPERVTDPLGNMEYAVGFWKFMRFAKKVVPQWVQKP
ncbi:hypothetical protein F5Y15DRAFT_415473 [Xylariaceae sp. FL0016]|nr:hypothetical protein F5Y15DRAFT_415473 [Xylariaceae sp. FL0016]